MKKTLLNSFYPLFRSAAVAAFIAGLPRAFNPAGEEGPDGVGRRHGPRPVPAARGGRGGGIAVAVAAEYFSMDTTRSAKGLHPGRRGSPSRCPAVFDRDRLRVIFPYFLFATLKFARLVVNPIPHLSG